MAIGLCIETSDEICSVAIKDQKGSLLFLESEEPRSHGRVITTLIDQLLNKANLNFKDLDFIAVSAGPGSYTGLRIGISTAKGMCFALDKPLVSLDVFEILKIAAEDKGLLNDRIPFAMIDARRMEVYAQKWNGDGTRNGDAFPLIFEESFIKAENLENKVFIGSGAQKINLIKEGQEFDAFDIRPHAKYMHTRALEKFKNGDLEDVAYFEPFYLKEFYITKPKNVLNTDNGK